MTGGRGPAVSSRYIFELVINIFTVRVDCELRVPALGPADAARLGHGRGDGRRDGEGGEHQPHRADVRASLTQSSMIAPLYNNCVVLSFDII